MNNPNKKNSKVIVSMDIGLFGETIIYLFDPETGEILNEGDFMEIEIENVNQIGEKTLLAIFDEKLFKITLSPSSTKQNCLQVNYDRIDIPFIVLENVFYGNFLAISDLINIHFFEFEKK